MFNIFQPYLGEMIQFDDHIFQRGWFNHQLVKEHLPKLYYWVPCSFPVVCKCFHPGRLACVFLSFHASNTEEFAEHLMQVLKKG